MKKKHKVLIVDHGSKYIKKLEKMYVDHPDIKYDVDVIKSDDVLGMKLKGYNIIHLSGSRVKKMNYIIPFKLKRIFMIKLISMFWIMLILIHM